MSYRKLWSDMHSNIHHNQMDELEQWYTHAKEVMDFWPIAYYPFYMHKTESGAPIEDLYPQPEILRDWERLRAFTKQANEEGWPLFMGYEWQGAGLDGDHNVFFLDNEQPMLHPMRYCDLRDAYVQAEAIAVPHHVAYQLGSRGKNWETHDAAFSPVVEIFSSHGSSENDSGGLDMERHLHMGPRTGETCYERGLEKGCRVGIIASGDNHDLPGVHDHGMMCVLAHDATKEKIWEAIKARRTYGVSRSRMDIDFTIGDAPMGACVEPGCRQARIAVTAANAIDRVELLRDSIPERTIVHSGTWERTRLPELFRFKFQLELGWGPNPRFYQDMLEKHWHGSLTVPGRLLSIEKCWNSYGQQLALQGNNACTFDLTTYMSTATGHWMGPSPVKKEGFVFEVEGRIDDVLTLCLDGEQYALPVRELLRGSRIIAQYRQSIALAEKTFGKVAHYRDDLYWHNAYKARVCQAAPQAAYTLEWEEALELVPGSNYRLRVWLKNADQAWTSPIFCE